MLKCHGGASKSAALSGNLKKYRFDSSTHGCRKTRITISNALDKSQIGEG